MVVRSLLIGLDGATFTVLDPLMDRGVMPFLRDLVAGGARASLRTVMPPLTPPGWTSLMTGKTPGQHGVFDFFQKESADSEYFRFANSGDVRASTIWSLASDQGQRVTALNFPLMFPPPEVNGCVVPGGWMPWRQLRLGCHPPGLFDRLRSLPSFNPREMSLDMALEAKAVEGCPEDQYAEWIELHIRREERWFEIARHLMQDEPAELVGVMFDGVDKLQHLCWRFIDPACQAREPSAWHREIVKLCEGYFRRLDEILAELVALAGPHAVVVLASDHGFGPTSEIFYVNSWLEQQGYLAWAAGGSAAAETAEVGFSQITRHISLLDWERTVAYAATPSSNGIHIVRRRPGSDRAMPPDVYREVRERLVGDLWSLRHPATGLPVVSEVHTREEAFAGPFGELAPDVSVMLAEGAAISILRSDTLFRRRPEPQGNHRWEGIFVASGPSVRSGVSLDELSICDVAPVLLYALGLPVPSDMAGTVPEAVFDPDHLRRQPPRSVTTGAAVRPVPATESERNVYDGEAEATILNRLRALGYVE